jgi:hypothetical protein
VIWLIISIIVALLGTTAIFIGRINETDRRGDIVGSFNLRPIGVAVLAVGLIVLAFDSFTIVPTRNLAVQTSFGKPTGTLRNGFHPAAPWSDIHTFDATIQTLKMSADDTKDQGDPITVRLANAATAKVDVTVQWQIDPDADITQLYLDFRDFDNIGNRPTTCWRLPTPRPPSSTKTASTWWSGSPATARLYPPRSPAARGP